MTKKLIFGLFCIIITYIPGNTHYLTASHTKEESEISGFFDKYSTPWVDSIFNSLTIEERIAQLLMIRVHTEEEIVKEGVLADLMILQLLIKKEETYYDSIAKIIKKYNVGGIAFFRGNPENQVKITNKFQQKASTPLLVAMDAEWGLGMRLDNTISFPRQMTLGAIQNDNLIYEMGIEIARQLRRIGVHINFAPVADVNSNPLNPVINFRSFGECRYNVTNKSLQYMMGLQDWGIIANAKHFPGHGDTNKDSHYTLPRIDHNHALIDSIHLYPFRHLMNNGLKSVMTAHLHIPVYDATNNLASTLSKNMVTHLLQEEMGFNGLIITDALDMRGVSDYFKPGELELMALKAGNDILLLPEDVPAAINTIKKAIENGELSEHYLNHKCRKVLFYKEMVGLNNFSPISENNILEDINTQKAKFLNKQLIENAITLVKNQNDLIPLRFNENPDIASVAIGQDSAYVFHDFLANYYPVSPYIISRDIGVANAAEIISSMENYDIVIISLHNNSIFARSYYGINDKITKFIQDLSKNNTVILNLFANPYILNYFSDIENIESILISYQDGELYEEVSSQIIAGGLPAKGNLPVSINNLFPLGTGITTPSDMRIKFTVPEEVGLSGNMAYIIDSIVNYGIENEAYPGAQVVVIKDGNVIINNSYGYHTYDSLRKVKNSDIYDVASLTKIAATTAAIMHLKDRGLIDINKSPDFYLPWLKESNLAGISIRNIMSHQGQLHSWIPFFLETIKDGMLDTTIYSNIFSDDFSIKVADNLFIHQYYRDSIYLKIMDQPLRQRSNYLYSDLGFIMLAEVMEKVSNMKLNEYVGKHLYNPMGLRTMTFNPLDKFSHEEIVASEIDTIFRGQVIHGYVNDPAAAMLGGVSGHAGLFSNALDMAILMQMFLNGGSYNQEQYIKEETLLEFTSVQFADKDNRRGIGFDKPALNNNNNQGSTCKSASPESFGHSGFTGTYAWADPKENLVYVFLSNRVYPYSSNRKLIEMNIRSEIHQAIYNAINETRYLEYCKMP